MPVALSGLPGGLFTAREVKLDTSGMEFLGWSGPTAPGLPSSATEILSRELSRHFSGDERLSVTSRALPFGGRRAVVLNWPSWQVSLAYEEGGLVAEDSAEITRRLGAAVPCGLSGIRNRIRAVFGDDDGREYTNEAVQVLEFLTAIPGAVVFDPQQKDIIGGMNARPPAPSPVITAQAGDRQPTIADRDPPAREPSMSSRRYGVVSMSTRTRRSAPARSCAT